MHKPTAKTRNGLKPPSQIERFKAAATAIGCSDDPTAFDEAVKKVGTAKPKTQEAIKKDWAG